MKLKDTPLSISDKGNTVILSCLCPTIAKKSEQQNIYKW